MSNVCPSCIRLDRDLTGVGQRLDRPCSRPSFGQTLGIALTRTRQRLDFTSNLCPTNHWWGVPRNWIHQLQISRQKKIENSFLVGRHETVQGERWKLVSRRHEIPQELRPACAFSNGNIACTSATPTSHGGICRQRMMMTTATDGQLEAASLVGGIVTILAKTERRRDQLKPLWGQRY